MAKVNFSLGQPDPDRLSLSVLEELLWLLFLQSTEQFKMWLFHSQHLAQGYLSDQGSLRAVRKDEGSQLVGGEDPPSRVPFRMDLTRDGPLRARHSVVSPAGPQLLCPVFGAWWMVWDKHP